MARAYYQAINECLTIMFYSRGQIDYFLCNMRELNGLFYVYRHRFARFPPLGKKVDGKYFTVSLPIPI